MQGRQNVVSTGGPNRQYTGQNSGNNEERANQMASEGLEYGKKAMTMYRKEDAELWEIVRDLPRLNGVWPFVCCILNVFFPGTGTMISSCVGYSISWSKTQLVIGLLQLLTAVYIIGWLWSIWWGVILLKKGLEDKQEV